MVKRPTPHRKLTRRAAPRREAYHHGNLTEALIAATLQLIDEKGPDAVSVREAARRAGVSSGAPFRHFPNRIALMTAVAEQAMERLREEVVNALAGVPEDQPLQRLRAAGLAYVRWALRNPSQFQVVSSRNWIDFEHSASLQKNSAETRALMEHLVRQAMQRGEVLASQAALVPAIGRALTYGLARMAVDGHLSQWGIDTEREWEPFLDAALDVFMAGISPHRLEDGSEGR